MSKSIILKGPYNRNSPSMQQVGPESGNPFRNRQLFTQNVQFGWWVNPLYGCLWSWHVQENEAHSAIPYLEEGGKAWLKNIKLD